MQEALTFSGQVQRGVQGGEERGGEGRGDARRGQEEVFTGKSKDERLSGGTG